MVRVVHPATVRDFPSDDKSAQGSDSGSGASSRRESGVTEGITEEEPRSPKAQKLTTVQIISSGPDPGLSHRVRTGGRSLPPVLFAGGRQGRSHRAAGRLLKVPLRAGGFPLQWRPWSRARSSDEPTGEDIIIDAPFGGAGRSCGGVRCSAYGPVDRRGAAGAKAPAFCCLRGCPPTYGAAITIRDRRRRGLCLW